MPLDRVWFSDIPVFGRVYKSCIVFWKGYLFPGLLGESSSREHPYAWKNKPPLAPPPPPPTSPIARYSQPDKTMYGDVNTWDWPWRHLMVIRHDVVSIYIPLLTVTLRMMTQPLHRVTQSTEHYSTVEIKKIINQCSNRNRERVLSSFITNPLTPESDQCQISPVASPEILHHAVGFHSLLRWKMIILPILTTLLIHFLFKRSGECSFWAQE